MKTLTLICLSFAAATVSFAGCTDAPLVWTLYASYTDPSTGLTLTSAITGDGAQTDGSGNTVYSTSSGATQVAARLNQCGTHPSYDATLQISKGRAFNVDLGSQLGNSYQKFPPTSFFSKGSLLNISDIMWCQNNGFSNGCTFYTRMTSALTGPDGLTYHLRMENPSAIPATSWSADSTANCPYTTSAVQIVFTPGSRTSTGKDTYVVTPVLQGGNTGSGWTAPAPAAGCPATNSLPAGIWPAGVGALIQDGTGNSYNFGQYNTPFQFVIRNQ